MNFIQFIRIILDHRFLIVGVGVIMALTIYYSTRNEVKEYSSSAVVYTGLATGYNIESGRKQRFDLFGTRVAFDNFINIIKSNDTRQEVVLKLLARHLVYDAQDSIDYNHLRKLFPDSTRYKLLDIFSVENTKQNLYRYMNLSDTNKVYTLLRGKHRFYSLDKISSIKVQRVQSSDLLEISYTCEHPRICQETIEILIDVFRQKYHSVQSNRTSSVIKYFEERVIQATKRLNNAEKSLLEFRTNNKIINYYEQTKSIAVEKENLDHEYQVETMELASSQAALDHLENTLSKKINLGLQSKIIVDKRKKLHKVSSNIATLEIEDPNTPELLKLKKELAILKLELKSEVDKLYKAGRSVSGVPVASLLKEWLNNAIAVEERNARVKIILETRENFSEKYNTFAPLGSELKRIEREIEIAESEYMNFLKSWNDSKLRQQNIDMQSSSNSIKILDAPFYPLKAKASKRMFLVVAGLMAGMIFTLAILIFLEFIDNSINNLERVTELTGLVALGAFPNLKKQKKDIDYPYIINRVVEIMMQKIKLTALSFIKEKKEAYLIIITSTRREEGCHFLSDLFAQKLTNAGNNILFLSPEHDKINKNEVKESYFKMYYEIKNNFFNINTIDELLGKEKNIFLSAYDYIFFNLPSLLYNEFPTSLVKNSQMSLLICDASRVWNKADTQALNLYTKTLDYKPLVVLNGIRIELLEDIVGEIPRKRSWFRRNFKRLISGNFSSRKENV